MGTAEACARTEAYLAVPAVVGFERPFAEHLIRDLRARGLEVLERRGLVVARGGGPGTISAHIDRHGLVAHRGGFVYAAAFARSARDGDPLPIGRTLREAVCARFGDEPVYAYDPSTGERVAEGTVRHEHLCGLEDDLFLHADGFHALAEGTPVAFSHRCMRGDGWFRGQLDNVISAAIAVELFDVGFTGTALFTTEEEIGHSWEHLLGWFDETGPVRDLLVHDTSPFDEPEPVEGGVLVLRNRDANGAFDPDQVGRVRAAAEEAGASVVMKDELLAAAGKVWAAPSSDASSREPAAA